MKLKGLSIEDIISPESSIAQNINKLNTSDLKSIVSRLVSASNKRIKRLGETKIGKLSPAYSYITKELEKTGGKFSVKGKTLDELRNTYATARNFLQSKTSSIRGWTSFRTELESKLGIDLSGSRKAHQFWKTYRKIADTNIIEDKNSKSRLNSERIQEWLAEQYNQKGGFNQSIDDVLNIMNKKIAEAHELQSKEELKFDRPSNYIDEDEEDYDLEI